MKKSLSANEIEIVSMKELQKNIGYVFRDETLFNLALTHSSYALEQGWPRESSNQRLEFLGDAFLDAIIGEALFEKFPRAKEGELTKMRANLVCEKTLAALGRNLGLGKALRLGIGMRKNGGADQDSVLADTVEALIGAFFLDSGYETAKKTTLFLFKPMMEKVDWKRDDVDYKSQLQEFCQNKGPVNIVYRVMEEQGPPHDKTFSVAVEVDGELQGQGRGKSKKSAQQKAAKEALARRK